MKIFEADEWFAFRETLLLVRRLAQDPTLQGTTLFTLQSGLSEFSKKLDEFGMGVSSECADRLKRAIDAFAEEYVVAQLCADLAQRIEDDARRRVFVLLESETQRLFVEPMHGWETAIAAYPRICRDAEEASKCIALELPTAAAFHCLRVLEYGLKVLAKCLGIDYQPSWESYITKINENMGSKYASKPLEWRANEPFFREVLGDLIAIKNAWRNSTMHIERDYMPGEAKQVYHSAQLLLARMAEKGIPDIV